jgi:hypothetical protein
MNFFSSNEWKSVHRMHSENATDQDRDRERPRFLSLYTSTLFDKRIDTVRNIKGFREVKLYVQVSYEAANGFVERNGSLKRFVRLLKMVPNLLQFSEPFLASYRTPILFQ